jgi:hypothetical protein
MSIKLSVINVHWMRSEARGKTTPENVFFGTLTFVITNCDDKSAKHLHITRITYIFSRCLRTVDFAIT